MKRLPILTLVLLALLPLTQVFAVRVSSIYQAAVPVASQSEELRPQAIQEALTQVLVKVSGNSQIADNPGIKSSLAKAEQLVQEFSYSSAPPASKMPYLFNAGFDAKSINRILRHADVPIWGQNRQLIVAWIEYEVPGKPAVIIDNETASDIQGAFKLYADQHGIPLLLPVMDVTDMNLVSVNDVVTMSLPPLQNASKRYASDGILIARVFKQQVGYSIRSKLIIGTQQWDWDVKGNSIHDVVTSLLNNISDTLAGHHASPVANTVQSQVIVKVTNVSADGDLEQLMQYISHLAPVAEVQPEHITGTEVVLKINLRSSKDALVEALSLDQKLQSVGDTTDNVLEYLWNP